jgi:hypothetical protein
MRLSLVLAAVLLLAVTPASAQLSGPSFGSDNVEHVTNVLTHFDTAGARLHDGRFYVTTERDVTIYDVAQPEAPQALGSFDLPEKGEPTFTEEDPDTNGRILPVSNAGVLMVIDVSDPANISLAGSTDDAQADQHTWTCVLDCAYGYGSEGAIADLRDPKNPRIVGDWRELWPADSTHDLTEVAPGVLMSATQPFMYLLDARTDPLHPALLMQADVGTRFIHQAAWPNGGADPLALSAGEALGPGCSEDEATEFTTYKPENGTLRKAGAYRLSTGTLLDGRSPETTWCTHWFSPHPTFHGGGAVAIAWYEHGTRFLKVSADGAVEEIGSWLAPPTQASGAYWITDRIVYVADYLRGLDVLRFTGEIPAPGVAAAPAAGGAGGPAGAGGATSPAGGGPAATPPPAAPRFRDVARVSCRRGVLRVRARDARVSGVAVFRGAKRLARGKRTTRVKARRSSRLRVVASLHDGTKIARLVRGCR